MKKAAIIIPVLLSMIGLLSGCGVNKGSTAEDTVTVQIYYVNKEETKVVPEEFQLEKGSPLRQLAVLLNQLRNNPEDTTLRAAIPDTVQLQDYFLEDEGVVLEFQKNYYDLSLTGEVLTRAAVVRTLTQIEGIGFISFLIEGDSLTDNSGNVIGAMSAEQFVDNAGNEINAIETASLDLYFTDETGSYLIECIQEVDYNSNISIERLVVEYTIAGPTGLAEIYPTVNPETKVSSVTVKDGTCYVGLDNAFLTKVNNVSSEVAVYSIVNALVELPNVNKVQISINDETNVVYNEEIPLSEPLERNLEIIGQ